MPTRILLLADTHGRLHPKILALAARADLAIHAGDIGNSAVLSSLAATGCEVRAIRGNNDTAGKWPAVGQDTLAKLGDRCTLTLPGGELAVEHGDRCNPVDRRHALLRDRYPHARLVLYGHSHRQIIDDADTPWVVNPGAAGRSRTYGGAGCILLTVGARRWHLEPFRFSLDDWEA